MDLLKHSREGQARLEKQGKFDVAITPYSDNDTIPIDENYRYLTRNPGFIISRGIIRALLFLLGPLATKLAFNTKYYGREKLKPLKGKGFFTISNHCSFLDIVLNIRAVKHKSVYMTVAEFNNKKGFAGAVLRTGGILPLATKPSAVKNMKNAFHTLIEKKKVVHFYAEAAMWLHYKKPRPMKRGAFYYAVQENTPVVPIFIRWTPSKGLRKLFGIKEDASIIILDPIYPKEGLSLKENTIYMQRLAQREYTENYRDFFGVSKEEKPCIYDIDPEYMDTLDEETKYAVTL